MSEAPVVRQRAPDAPVPDAPARGRISVDLDTTLFVEAGAGSGKTSKLVDRVVALVTSGAAPLRSVAAITFTEKAGSELRDRIRRELERVASAVETPTEVVELCRAALDELDAAAIGTLHSFAQRILSEHPIEAGLPPRVEVLDEVSSDVEFDARWTTFRDALLADPEVERTLLLFLACGVKIEALKILALAFDQSWDLVEDRVPATAPDPPSVREPLEDALRMFDAVCAERARGAAGDGMVARLDDLAAMAARLRACDDELEVLDALGPTPLEKLPSFKVGGTGRAPNWGGQLPSVRDRVVEAGEALLGVRERVAQACARRLAVEIRRFTLEAAAERRAAGRLQFHDLLVMARAMLRDPVHGASVRSGLARRYERVLLDEFQDTDPIQIELAVRIAAADPSSEEAAHPDWSAVPVGPGRLFVVGDPKQSIYRFRRADIAVFLKARKRFGGDGGLVELTANFRTAEPVIDWVNAVFGALTAEPPQNDIDVPSQPDYVALDPVRPAPPVGPPVSVLGRGAHPSDAGAGLMREAEARDVAATIARIVSERWSVRDGSGDGWRPAGLGDITVLVPARTSLPFLEEALEDAGISYRAESSSLVYATRAVRDVLMTMRAIDDPTDHLSIVSALRSPLFACGDDDLYRFKVERKGSWSFLAPPRDTMPVDDPVRRGLEYLRARHDERYWRSPSELLDTVVRDRRALELGFADSRPRDVWRRLRFVIDQARAWSEATGGTLRDYLHWIDQQTAEGARVAEAILPETDDAAVRIMTIHAAKGLEFPITIVSGMSTKPGGVPASAQVAFLPDGGVGYKFGRHVTTEEFEAFKPLDEQMGFDERIRLLYVACTRAKDHLVVSLHRKARAKAPDSVARTNAELFISGMGPLLEELPDAVAEGAPPPVTFDRPLLPSPPPPFEEWDRERTEALARASRPAARAATGLTSEGDLDPEDEPAAGLLKGPRDQDLPPWLKGRYGTSVGRAVHGVLQTIDLATGEGLDAAVAAQCEAEAVHSRAADVKRLVQDALGSDVVKEAARSQHWREIYVCVPDGESLLEGYVDLLYRTDEGLVVVDYKTAASSDDANLDERMELYRLQGEAYRKCVSEATAEPVARVVFLFLTPDGPRERVLEPG